MKIVLAYSGGLDTSVLMSWIKEKYHAEMIGFCADIGQEEELHGLEKKALKTGASKIYIDDLQEEFARDFIFPMMQAGAIYDQVRMLAAAWSSVDSRSVRDVVRYLRRWPYRGVNGVYYFGETGQTPKLYPDMTSDAALGQAHLVYQIGRSGHTLLDPEPFGTITDFTLPKWCQSAG